MDKFEFPLEVPEIGQKIQVKVLTPNSDEDDPDTWNVEEGIVINRYQSVAGICVLLQHPKERSMLYDRVSKKWECHWFSPPPEWQKVQIFSLD